MSKSDEVLFWLFNSLRTTSSTDAEERYGWSCMDIVASRLMNAVKVETVTCAKNQHVQVGRSVRSRSDSECSGVSDGGPL